MFTKRNSPPLRFVVLAILCVLGLCGPGWTQKPEWATKAASHLDPNSPLRKDPALQVKFTVDFRLPKAQDIVERMRKETKVDLSLADNIDRERPALGSLSCAHVSAWIILEELAKSKIIQGKWERRGDGYRLTSPLPPPPPLVVAKANPPAPPSVVEPRKLGLHYLLFTLPIPVIFGILLLIRRRRSQQSVAASAPSHSTGTVST